MLFITNNEITSLGIRNELAILRKRSILSRAHTDDDSPFLLRKKGHGERKELRITSENALVGVWVIIQPWSRLRG